MTSSRLIGRVAELAELEAALRDAADGRPSLAFVAGESGVGKSRMVSEFARRTRDGGARVAIGECVELGEEELPYAPIVSVLRSLAREGDAVLDELPPGVRAELATLLPELGRDTAGRAPDELRANETTLGQPRLFEALLTLLDQLGRDQPFALVLEDIHWADRSTRAFLVFLGRSLWSERVLVIATYRSDELHRRHPLRPLLAELERDTRARRIELTRLSRDELGELLDDILGGPSDEELVERLYARSEGNPLFTEELLAARLDGRGGLPTTLRDALMVRIERLSEPAQEVLRLLSAARILSHDVLADASGLGGSELRAVVREAAESNVIVADARGRYQFRHALLREVVHDDLLPGEHAELHLALARALEAQLAETDDDAIVTAGIAHHYLSAGCQREALVASVRAADAAERVHAHGEAGALLERALDLWSRVPDATEQIGCDRIELVRRASRALINDGSHGRAEALLKQAIGEVDEQRDPRLAAGLLELLSRAQWSLGRAEDARASVTRAVELLPEDEAQSPERARILSRQAKIAMQQGRFSEVLPSARAALEAAAETDAGPRADALNAMGLSLILLGDVEEGSANLREAIAVSPVGFERTSAWSNLADALHLVGRSDEALAAAEQGLEATSGRGRGSDWMTMTLGEIQWDLGDWALARRHMSPVDRRHERHHARLRRAQACGDRARRRRPRAGARVARPHRRPRGELAGAAVHRAGRIAAGRARAPRRRSRSRPRRRRRRPRRDRVLLRGPLADRPAVGDRRLDRGRRRAACARPRRRRGRARGDLPRRRLRATSRGLRRGRPARRGRPSGVLARAPGARPRRRAIRRSTPRRRLPGVRSPAPTRRRPRSCGARRRWPRSATARPPPPSSSGCSQSRTRSGRRGCEARPTAWPPARGWPSRPHPMPPPTPLPSPPPPATHSG